MRDGAGDGGDGLAAATLGGRFGPYFALEVLTPADADADAGAGGGASPAGWSAVADLADPATGAFTRRAAAVRTALAAAGGGAAEEVDERVAVSVAQLGVCARLVAPALALAVATGRPPLLRPARLYWQDTLGGPFPLAVDGPPVLGAVAVAGETASARLARGLDDGVLTPVIVPFVAAVERHHPVSSKILWGNVASGLAGAAKMIGLAEPAAARLAWGVVAALCAGDGPLRGTGGVDAPGRFRRRSCCLIYRLAPRAAGRAVPPGALCEDCVLHGR